MKYYFTPVLTTSLLLLGFAPHAFSQSSKINLLWEETKSVRTIKFSAHGNRLITVGSLGNCYPYECGQIKV